MRKESRRGELPSGIPELFGSQQRTLLMALIAGLGGEAYPRELSRMTGISLLTVQRIVADYERQGVLVSRLLGRVRRLSLNPQYVVARELAALLDAIIADVEPVRAVLLTAARQRPRRAGKAL
jgi:DNA-binding transcriptional ArsR family regulator